MTELPPTNEEKKEIRILLVEDHALTRMGLKTALKRVPDFQIIGEAVNGEVAVKMAEELHPDVILMDVGMPILDGIHAADQIISKAPDIRVIMLTQHDNDSDIWASLAAGASGYCLKDVEPERLYTAIRSVASGDTWLDSTIAGRVLKHFSGTTAPARVELPAADQPIVTAEVAEQPPVKAAVRQVYDRPLAEPLSARELEVLQLIVDGLSNQQIAEKLVISLATAKTHVRNILNKLAVDDRTQAAVHAMRRGLV